MAQKNIILDEQDEHCNNQGYRRLAQVVTNRKLSISLDPQHYYLRTADDWQKAVDMG